MGMLFGLVLAIAACTGTPRVDGERAGTYAAPEWSLHLPDRPQALLVLFPCYSCDTSDTRTESRIVEEAGSRGVAVLLMGINRRIFLSEAELQALVRSIHTAIDDHDLRKAPVFFGGFSSGGNVSVLLAKHLAQHPEAGIGLKGLFVVDPPLDLAHVYANCVNDTAHPNPGTAEEARMVVRLLEDSLGRPQEHPETYLARSPITVDDASVELLKPYAVRLYTEPDTVWWREQRGQRYEELNAWRLKQLEAQLQRVHHPSARLIETSGRGVQHGRRHPHAWSIVDEKELMNWVLGEVNDRKAVP